MPSILLVDDNENLLNELAEKVEVRLRPGEAEVRKWLPSGNDTDPRAKFTDLLADDTRLVVTDFILSKKGLLGFFGPSVVEWSQSRLIPVGDFSRGPAGTLPKEPNLFEMRVPADTGAASAFVVSVYRGFTKIATAFENEPALLELSSPSAILAKLLQVPNLESQFALYGVRLGTMSSALMSKITDAAAPNDQDPNASDKRAILIYVIGHLLLNAILKFPGPIIDGQALAAYVGVAPSELEAILPLFSNATYDGPFAELGSHFWLHKLDDVLTPMLDALPGETDVQTGGELNRLAIEGYLDRELARHGCSRCHGANGGFYCPFTKRAVCIRDDCSVGANSWIPQGASLCRVERVFYDEWAPILGF